ncbi:MAG: hypothetical protein KBC84_08585 [Proteobacteria bacterium]|nr:hypothetical protein [Pseudomonadota bacterium]
MKFLIYFHISALFLFIINVQNSAAAVVTIQNDFSESSTGSMLEISDLKAVSGSPVINSLTNVKVYVMPGQVKRVSMKNLTAFTVSRVYGDYKEKYEIACPVERRQKDNMTINFRQITENDLPGGCAIKRKGKWTSAGGLVWEQQIHKVNLRDKGIESRFSENIETDS